MKKILIIFCIALSSSLFAQKFDGFVITESDSIFKGYMRILNGGEKGIKFLITRDKKKKPRAFFSSELKYYAFKKDTFAYLQNFYLFENTEYPIERLEAKVLFSHGNLKLYSSSIIPHKKDPQRVTTYFPGAPMPNGMPGVGSFSTQAEPIYIVKNRDGYLTGVRKNKKDFIKAMEVLIGDNTELISEIKSGKLRFADMKKIIALYNKSRNEVSQ